ncbi:hypothetical protein JQ580_04265 [Bradyrhizobium japonicum]|uniref:hypothetical protein n=1 Tax=Bradyrhizobium japonicum TaxID=375 RepID=UPI001BA92577|nr:hypothetical protein [Bradyrhizobium japonicum]MBR0989928.1 hypothetical protein [Bradyrhizobium japonicum]
MTDKTPLPEERTGLLEMAENYRAAAVSVRDRHISRRAARARSQFANTVPTQKLFKQDGDSR